ncbi:D-glycerate dehydrogenase [Siminovitchia fortis]|uniref:D-glycerate dehydrogenase n=1 Tax=Siminovitchia fortis TaxID=254758 RepID=A0A443IRC9_9BACI|nr:D-glycerate dehydrogenase [Siminovitchia fortis]RWR09651.1 D-glycerate dehydrogenase [Siminovitchia fortis]WHY82274.1 D-glycerate dehydrogenase [Siminovitchia fortis]
MKEKIYITRKLPAGIVKKLEGEFNIDMWDQEEEAIPREVLLEKVKDVQGLLCMLTETIDEEVMDAAPGLKVISNMAVGYNNIDVDAATNREIVVTNTPGVLTETTADLTFALMMATARRLVEASDYLRNGKWETWSPMQLTGMDIHGATLGIIGFGRIGQAVAKRAAGFGMNILYYNRSQKPDAERETGARFAELNDVLRESDFISILLPYSEEVHHLISAKELSLMKKTAVLINTARGGIVDEDALYDALKNETIWAAGLDVFEKEPIDPSHPLLTLPNVVTLPHIGSASIATRMKMAELAADNLHNSLVGSGEVKSVNYIS